MHHDFWKLKQQVRSVSAKVARSRAPSCDQLVSTGRAVGAGDLVEHWGGISSTKCLAVALGVLCRAGRVRGQVGGGGIPNDDDTYLTRSRLTAALGLKGQMGPSSLKLRLFHLIRSVFTLSSTSNCEMAVLKSIITLFHRKGRVAFFVSCPCAAIM